MSFDLASLRAHATRGPIVRVVVAATQGSVPREVGASMVVGPEELIDGTIGGGTLEYEAIATARSALENGKDRLDRLPLGPSLGQCCGGSVTLLTEIWDVARIMQVEGEAVVRPAPGATKVMPLAVSRVLAGGRSGTAVPAPGFIDGWMVEPVARPTRDIWVWGAGHVGRALVSVLAPLPGLKLYWVDSSRDRFPDVLPPGVEQLISGNPADLVSLASGSAEHFVLTYSHALDLEICHRVLAQPFRYMGLIGSATKRARFRSRLAALGHGDAQIARMICPIGDPSLGKHPQEIAVGVAAEILRKRDLVGVGMTEESA